jgi:histone H3
VMPTSRENARKSRQFGRMVVQPTKRMKKPARAGPCQKAKREIRSLQMSTEHLIPKAAFQRLVRGIAEGMDQSIVPGIHKELGIAQDEYHEPITRFTGAAMKALQSATEAYVINILEAAKDNADHRNGKTIDLKDMLLARKTEKRFAVDPHPSYGDKAVHDTANNWA